MPEGPEVETIRKGLLNLIDTKIDQVQVADHKKYNPIENDILQLEGMNIDDIHRRGKFLVWYFSDEKNELAALNHLGMTGVWYHYSNQVWNEFDDPFEEYKHWKVCIKLSDNSHLLFVNVRTFGRFVVMTPKEIEEHKAISRLGPDILEQPFDVDEFIARVKGKNRPRTKDIGKLLLDYNIIAGCGNIYKNEALFKAKIHPMTPANKLSKEDLEVLGKALSNVAQLALKFKGSTLQDYRHVDGYEGLMQDKFNVYDLEGENCPRCNDIIVSGKQGNRTSFWCPNCQKLP